MARRANTVRIIGGKWKGRKIGFPSAPGLRPTMDRVRETLFNWLVRDIPDARVLDLFAGSGALAFEALSRGAASATMIDNERRVVASLQREARELNANCEVIRASALAWLERNQTSFDIVFVDPPFDSRLAATVLARLRPDIARLVYVEQSRFEAPPNAIWRAVRTKRAGDLQFGLFKACD